MAQLVAHLHGMQGVRGSSPLRSTNSPGFLAKSGAFSLEVPWPLGRFSHRLDVHSDPQRITSDNEQPGGRPSPGGTLHGCCGGGQASAGSSARRSQPPMSAPTPECRVREPKHGRIRIGGQSGRCRTAGRNSPYRSSKDAPSGRTVAIESRLARVGVGVERRSRGVTTPADGHVLVRLGLLHDPARAVGDAAGWRGARWPEKRVVAVFEAAPEEVDRAGLADEAGLEDLQDAVDLDQRPPQQLRMLRVVRVMPLVKVERDGVGDLHRMGRDGDVDPRLRSPARKSR